MQSTTQPKLAAKPKSQDIRDWFSSETKQQKEKSTRNHGGGGGSHPAGVPATGLDESYSGLCSFTCARNYCPPGACMWP